MTCAVEPRGPPRGLTKEFTNRRQAAQHGWQSRRSQLQRVLLRPTMQQLRACPARLLGGFQDPALVAPLATPGPSGNGAHRVVVEVVGAAVLPQQRVEPLLLLGAKVVAAGGNLRAHAAQVALLVVVLPAGLLLAPVAAAAASLQLQARSLDVGCGPALAHFLVKHPHRKDVLIPLGGGGPAHKNMSAPCSVWQTARKAKDAPPPAARSLTGPRPPAQAAGRQAVCASPALRAHLRLSQKSRALKPSVAREMPSTRIWSGRCALTRAAKVSRGSPQILALTTCASRGGAGQSSSRTVQLSSLAPQGVPSATAGAALRPPG